MIDSSEDTIELWFKKGRDLAQKNFVLEATDCYSRAIMIKPIQAIDFVFRGQAFASLGYHIDAFESYDIAIEKDSSLVDAWNQKGVSLEENGDRIAFPLDPMRAEHWYKEALYCYNKALEKDPLYADAWNNKGICLHSLHRYNEALKCFNEVIRLDPNSGDPWYNKSITLSDIGERDAEAEAAMEKAKALGVSPY